MMVIGYIIRNKNLADDHSLDVMNRLIFRVFMPILLFRNIITLELAEALNINNLKLLLLATIATIAIAVFSAILLRQFVKEKSKCSVIIQGIFRSNLLLFGVTISASIYGEGNIGVVSLLSAFLVPLYNVMAVSLFEMYRGEKINLKKILVSIIRNPLILSSALAIVCVLFNISIPEILESPTKSLSQITTPLAFIVLGGTFHFHKLSKNITYLLLTSIGKLVLMPAIIFIIAYCMGFRNEAMAALLGSAAAPTAVSSFTMAKEMGGDGELAGQIVVVTSIFSILTIFLWVFGLKTAGLL
jgi:predicted permease